MKSVFLVSKIKKVLVLQLDCAHEEARDLRKVERSSIVVEKIFVGYNEVKLFVK